MVGSQVYVIPPNANRLPPRATANRKANLCLVLLGFILVPTWQSNRLSLLDGWNAVKHRLTLEIREFSRSRPRFPRSS